MANETPYADKINTVQTWLTESGWTVFDSAFDYNDLTGRAMSEFGYAHKDRARILIAKAARLLRGEYVQTHGGAPKGNTNRANGTKRRVSVPVDELTPEQREKYLS